MPVPAPLPNTYEASSCQETNSPYERFFSFFSAFRFRRRQQSVSCIDFISVFGCQPPWLHHTRLEVPSPLLRRWQSRMAAIRCDRAIMPGPHTVLCTSLAESGDSPVRVGLGGGAAHATAGDHRRLFRSQSGCPINASGAGIGGLGVPWRAKTQPRKASRTLA
jgi:hypothetical protein